MRIIRSEKEFKVGKAYLCWQNRYNSTSHGGTIHFNLITAKNEYCYFKDGLKKKDDFGKFNTGQPDSLFNGCEFMALEIDGPELNEFITKAFSEIINGDASKLASISESARFFDEKE